VPVTRHPGRDVRRDRAGGERELGQVDLILVNLLVFKGALLEHLLRELEDSCGAKAMKRGDRPVAGDPVGERPAGHSNPAFQSQTARGRFLRMPQVIKAKRPRDDARRILDALQPRQRREVFRAVLAPVDLQVAMTVPSRQVHLDDWKPAPNKCHENVNHWIRRNPECTAVRGWIFWPPDETGCCRFMAHSVVEEKDNLIDITPIELDTPREMLVFLRHLGTEEEFEPMKTACAEVVYPPITWEEWHESQTSAETDEEREIDL
jgi:hypothetical protein